MKTNIAVIALLAGTASSVKLTASVQSQIKSLIQQEQELEAQVFNTEKQLLKDHDDKKNATAAFAELGNKLKDNAKDIEKAKQSLAQDLPTDTNPTKTGLQAPPKDWQYEVPHQLKKPLIRENNHNEDDFRNVYNPGRKTTQGIYAQAEPTNTKNVTKNGEAPKNGTKQSLAQDLPTDTNPTKTGLQAPPKDWQYEVPHQLKKPLIRENNHNEDDFRNVYNPGRKTTQGIYAQAEPSAKNTSKNADAKNVTATAAFADPKNVSAPASMAQINPHNPTGLEPAPKDWQYELPHQLKKPNTWVNAHDEDDIMHWYNPNKTAWRSYAQAEPANKNESKAAFAEPKNESKAAFAEPKNESKAAFAEPAPAKNTTKNGEAPKNTTVATALAQDLPTDTNPTKTGLQAPPKDWQYEVPHQLKKPLIRENNHNEDDFRNVYNPGKKTTQGIYAQAEPAAKNESKAAFAEPKNESKAAFAEPKNESKAAFAEPKNESKAAFAEPKNESKAAFAEPKNESKAAFAEPKNESKAAFADPKDKNATRQSLSAVNPSAPTGLEPAPKDWQYEVPHQLKKPLIKEQMHNEDDLRNVYNPGRKTTQGEYVQAEPKNETKAAFAAPAAKNTTTAAFATPSTNANATKQA